MEFDHIGVATRTIDEDAATFEAILEAPVVHEETGRDLRFVFLELENGYFELIEPQEDDDLIASFLSKHGPGMHHVAIRVEDVEAALAVARDAGVELIDEVPREGAWGHEVAFLHPGSTGGVLVEYVA